MLSADTKSLFDWRSRNFGIGPTITWPIFDAGRLRSVIDIRTAEQERAMGQYDRTVLGALEEAHNALVAFATEQERHRALVDAVKADQTSTDIALGQYRQGVIDFLNVLETQRSLFESQDQLADSDRIVTTSLIALYKALGGGWEAASSSTTTDQDSRSPEARAQTH
jgi:outer membrane protein TolC